jgi:lactoylglutathione lyase
VSRSSPAAPGVVGGAGLRLELFIDDLPTSIDFYTRVLGFQKEPERPGRYTPLVAGSVRVALNLRSALGPDHPIRIGAQASPGRGVEIVLEVDDVEAMYRHVIAEGWPRSSELSRQSWGLTDFRVLDPDGYYWRVTSRA